jgi:hypothetical protein
MNLTVALIALVLALLVGAFVMLKRKANSRPEAEARHEPIAAVR